MRTSAWARDLRSRSFRAQKLWATLAVLVAFLFCGPGRAAPTPPDVRAVLARLDDLYRSTSSIARIEIQVVRPRNTRSLRLQAWTRGEERVLVVVEAPAREQGTATLRLGENLWNYPRRIARTIRVPPSLMLGSWMGTDFTNDDLVRESSLLKDFEGRVDRRSAAPPRTLADPRREAERGGPVGAHRAAPLGGRAARRGTALRPQGSPRPDDALRPGKSVGRRRLPTRIVLTPEGEAGHLTEMRYLELQLDVPVSDDTFSLSRLERGR